MNEIIEVYKKINNFGRENQMRFNILAPGKVEYFMEIQEKHLATPLAAHGGVIAAFMDAILGVTALTHSSQDKNLVSTVEFKIHYFKPVLAGDTLHAIGQIESAGKRIIVCSAEIFAQNRALKVAKGMGTFNAYPLEKSGVKA
jgi:uncharacterized protein (TIGR00369 family)